MPRHRKIREDYQIQNQNHVLQPECAGGRHFIVHPAITAGGKPSQEIMPIKCRPLL
jgi:hypothetical protein